MWTPTSLYSWSPTRTVARTYFLGSWRSRFRPSVVTRIRIFGTGPVGLNRSADGSGWGGVAAASRSRRAGVAGTGSPQRSPGRGGRSAVDHGQRPAVGGGEQVHEAVEVGGGGRDDAPVAAVRPGPVDEEPAPAEHVVPLVRGEGGGEPEVPVAARDPDRVRPGRKRPA